MFQIINTPWNDSAVKGKSATIVFDEKKEHQEKELLDTVQHLKENKYTFIQTRIKPENKSKETLESLGFKFIEISYDLHYKKPQTSDIKRRKSSGLTIRKVINEADIIEAKKIAHDDFHFGRLHEDSSLDQSLVRMRNSNWIDTLNSYPYDFYIIEFKGKVIGFHAEKVNSDDNSVDWILTGVSKDYSLVSPYIWQEAFLIAAENNRTQISTVISAANTGVLNIYNAFPFRVTQAHLGYHLAV